MMTNRIAHLAPDYLLLLVQRPPGWRPNSVEDTPHGGEVLAKYYVASYEEAHDDLLRCNRLSLERGLNHWAIIQSPDAGL